MSKDKKNNVTKKRRKWLDILRWVLIVVLLVVGLALIFNKSIRNTVIAWNTNKYQVSKISKKTIEKNKEAKTSFDFDTVKSISTESVLQAQMDAQDKHGRRKQYEKDGYNSSWPYASTYIGWLWK